MLCQNLESFNSRIASPCQCMLQADRYCVQTCRPITLGYTHVSPPVKILNPYHTIDCPSYRYVAGTLVQLYIINTSSDRLPRGKNMNMHGMVSFLTHQQRLSLFSDGGTAPTYRTSSYLAHLIFAQQHTIACTYSTLQTTHGRPLIVY